MNIDIIPFFDDSPVEDLPEGGEVGGAAVLVVEVVGVLPDVEGEEGLEAAGYGVAGIGLLGDDEGAVGIGGEPDPAGAEEADAFGYELVLEGFEAAPLLYNLLAKRALGSKRPSAGTELREVHLVVEDLAGIVEEGAGGFRHDLFERQLFQAAAGQQLIQVVHIGLQMLAVVEGQGAGADDGIQGVQSIGEGDQGKHGVISFSF